MNEPFYSFKSFLKKKFPGEKIRKIPIDAGFPCPNKNGSLSRKGCIFCDSYGSGPVKTTGFSIKRQIETFMENHPGIKYIAYYQANTNTCAPPSELERKYEIVFSYPAIVGLSIGTRPDAINPGTYPLLEKLNRRIYLSVELGLQSIHRKSLRFLNRNHTYTQFLDTFSRLKEHHIDVVVHLIVGIPGENRQQILETVREMNRLKPAGIKFHLMHVLRDTPLEQLYRQKAFRPLSQKDYTDLMADILEHLDPGIVVHRLTGEREKELFVAPLWALNKNRTIQAIRTRMIQRHSRQGIKAGQDKEV